MSKKKKCGCKIECCLAILNEKDYYCESKKLNN